MQGGEAHINPSFPQPLSPSFPRRRESKPQWATQLVTAPYNKGTHKGRPYGAAVPGW